MLRYRRLTDAELRGDRLHHEAGWMLAGSQELQDPSPDGISEDVQRVHWVRLSMRAYISKDLYFPTRRPISIHLQNTQERDDE